MPYQNARLSERSIQRTDHGCIQTRSSRNTFPEVVFPEELPEAYRSCCLRIGSYIVIRYVLNEYKLPKLLERWFPKDIGLLMDLVSYLIVDEENAGQYYPDFAFCHPLFSEGMRIYSDSKISRFFKKQICINVLSELLLFAVELLICL